MPTIQQIAQKIAYGHDKRVDMFRDIQSEIQSEVLLRLGKHVQYDILNQLDKQEIVSLLERLDPDEATDILQVFSKRKQETLLREMTEQMKNSLSVLLQFDPETAGGLMNLDYIIVDADDTVAHVAKRFKVHEKRTGRLPAIIVSREGNMAGYLPGHELGFSRPSEKVYKHVRNIETIHYSASHEDVLKKFRLHPHNKLVVFGEKNAVLGIIYSDDVLRLMHEQESKSLYDFAGVSDEEGVFDSAPRKIRYRYKWLIVNLATAFLAAFTVGFFEDTVSRYVLLAVYMPIVAGMGGNAATQTLAVLVRGISLRQIDLAHIWRTLRNELLSGFVNGLINGVLVAGVVLFVNRDIKIALILASAMIINLLVAAFFGTLVPLVMKHFGKDPASSATIFITTATDVLGFLAFLGLATIVLA
ncbi:MAG: magnesium transporter [Candidatus Niyogibacteria bacterium CG10_big_fil_rev_8_21_14_0_10_46_36]|uniref:Magnesium transporter n=1 Tax=Candidatus Niyogibacteria bacterium CG10_big_fil_rev_8_21_14_0_10_46_36 TaxID=1974726 RepID=A0A2H0TG44_9BACT|nr:MAG: magnesium transporter [Candidatus Niyogibacteria bacterium CG10_big_fil_rev_8_21_14_0_10_46_36]